ncbi:MAG: hypothetical protein K2L98_01890 [Bacilli bacterium]|nr:hypothetical protein [Bacilli bacterium]
MSKIVKICLIVFVTLVMCNEVFASENYYTNNNGVIFTEEEYNFLSKMYWEGCQDLFTQKDYEDFVNSKIIEGEFQTVEASYSDNLLFQPFGENTAESNSKIIKISTSCQSNCTVSVTVTWKTIPKTRSYDVIGARFSGNKLIDVDYTKAISTTKTNSSTDVKKLDNGFGVSVLLPNTGTTFIVNQGYTVTKGGTIYASYQHAKRTISLANSKNYTISKDGYGGVFKFSGTAANVYDAMRGVSLTV